MTLVDFLRARLDEDESVAERLRSSSVGDPWGWQPNRLETCEKRRVDYPPARVLADVKAKRAIVEAHQGWHVCPNTDGQGYTDYHDGSNPKRPRRRTVPDAAPPRLGLRRPPGLRRDVGTVTR
jgi:hypothetical protein